MSARVDDAAQVVLRALLAWPALGLLVGVVARGVLIRNGDPVEATFLAFTTGAGLGAALAVAAVGFALGPLGRRWPRVRASLELPLLVLLAPVALLGGEFVRELVERGSSVDATRALLAARAPLELVDLDAALSAGLVLSGLVVGRALGWRPAAQAAASTWAVLAGVALRLALGRLELVSLHLVLGVEGGLAALAPFVVDAADRAVRDGRGQLARRGVTDADDREGHRLAPLLWLTVLASPAAAGWSWGAAWSGATPLALAVLPVAVAAVLAVAAARAFLLGAPRRVPVALVGGTLVATAGALAVGVDGWEGLAAPSAVAALGVVLAGRLAARATSPRRASRLARAALGLALCAGLLVAHAAWTGPDRPALTGWHVRARLGLWLGADPIGLLRDAERRLGDRGPWLERVVRPTFRHLGELAPLLQRAADRGDVAACLLLTSDLKADSEVSPDQLRWLRTATDAGDPEGAWRLLVVTTRARVTPAPTPPDAAAAGDVLLAAGRAGVDTTRGLALVWATCPGRRAEVEALVEAEPGRWLELVRSVVAPTRPDGATAPARALLRVTARHLRLPLDPEEPTPHFTFSRTNDGDLLRRLLTHDPTLAGPGDAALWLEFTAPATWPVALSALDLGPLDGARSPALAAAARGDLAAVWSAAVTGPDGADDPSTLRARAHALLAEARAPRHRAGAVRLAQAHLHAARAHELRDAATAWDQLLLDLHLVLPGGDATGLALELDRVEALRDERDEEVTARVEGLRRFVVVALGPIRADELPDMRRAAADDLRARAARPGVAPEVAARQRRAAARLEGLP